MYRTQWSCENAFIRVQMQRGKLDKCQTWQSTQYDKHWTVTWNGFKWKEFTMVACNHAFCIVSRPYSLKGGCSLVAWQWNVPRRCDRWTAGQVLSVPWVVLGPEFIYNWTIEMVLSWVLFGRFGVVLWLGFIWQWAGFNLAVCFYFGWVYMLILKAFG